MYVTIEQIVRDLLAYKATGKELKLGVAISGGGVRGAYAAGAIEALMQNIPRKSHGELKPAVITEVDDIRRFAHEKKFFSYMGLVPSTYSSGGKTFHGRLTKQGNRYLRWALVEAVWPAIRSDEGLRAYYHRLQSRKGPNPAKVATARRLATIVYRVLSQHRTYRPFGSKLP
jgi:transposase